jgi:Xaa-Pro aminopeptidase
VYEVVLAAQQASIDKTRVGIAHKEIHWTTVRVLTEGMISLGLLKGSVDQHIEEEGYKRWYPHGTSHWLGLDVHDVGSYGRGGRSRELESGMVLTIEPGLYIAADAEDAPEGLRGIGVRIEDDILVTANGPESLTAGAPKTVEAIEALMDR